MFMMAVAVLSEFTQWHFIFIWKKFAAS